MSDAAQRARVRERGLRAAPQTQGPMLAKVAPTLGPMSTERGPTSVEADVWPAELVRKCDQPISTDIWSRTRPNSERRRPTSAWNRMSLGRVWAELDQIWIASRLPGFAHLPGL